MNKRKGFTLIELLAVIVILAIIALITTPIMMNVIEKSKKGAAEISAENYISAVEITVARQLMNGKQVEGEYTIQEDGNLCPMSGCGNNDEQKEIIEVSGTKPTMGNIKIGNGKVLTTSTILIGDYDVLYNEEKKLYVANKIYKGILCKANTSKASAWLYSGTGDAANVNSFIQQEVGLIASESGSYTLGVAYTCDLGDGKEETFYVLEDNGYKVSLLLGRNLGNKVAWCSDENSCKVDGQWNNSAGPITAMNALNERTAGWTKLNSSQISMPTRDQISKTTGNIYGGLPTWIDSYTEFSGGIWGGHYGYWTSTPSSSNSSSVIYINTSYFAIYGSSPNGSGFGVRPVITILKSNLS